MSRDRQRLVGAIGSKWIAAVALSASVLWACGSGSHDGAQNPVDASATDAGGSSPEASMGLDGGPGPADSSAETSDATGATGDAAILDAGRPFALTAKAHLLVAETQRYCAASAALLVSCQSNPPLPGDLTDQPPQDPLVTFDENDEHVGCGLTSSGAILCWGHGYDDESRTCVDGGGIFSCNQHPPAGVFTAISVGDQLACAVRADGALLCWTNSGEIPDAAPGGTFIDVSLDKNNDSACAVGTDGHVVFWSFAVPPQINDGPVQVVQQGGAVCVLDKTGMVQCVSGHVMTIPLPTGPFTEIAIGSAHVCGLRSDGQVTCTGTDAVAGLTPPAGPFTEIASGPSYVCGRTAAAVVVCWGGGWGDGG